LTGKGLTGWTDEKKMSGADIKILILLSLSIQ